MCNSRHREESSHSCAMCCAVLPSSLYTCDIYADIPLPFYSGREPAVLRRATGRAGTLLMEH